MNLSEAMKNPVLLLDSPPTERDTRVVGSDAEEAAPAPPRARAPVLLTRYAVPSKRAARKHSVAWYFAHQIAQFEYLLTPRVIMLAALVFVTVVYAAQVLRVLSRIANVLESKRGVLV